MMYLNRNPAGKGWAMLQGLANLVDGLVRIVTCGFVCTGFPVRVARAATLIAIKREKEARQ
jgi:hypothetical protein